jgi:NADPH:quinone reductase-like Zn-dependent oxidoreductase
MAKETMVTGVTLFTADQEELQLMYNHINALIKMNCIKPVIGTTYPLEQAAKAQTDLMNNNGSVGRLTLVVKHD